jgi:hypothetical protein
VISALFVALSIAGPARAQAPQKEEGERPDRERSTAPSEQTPPGKPRPPIALKPRAGSGSNVGDDASGGGARSAEPTKGGTPGTPSGSFTGGAAKP